MALQVITVGLSHKTAPVALREQLAIPQERVCDLVRSLHDGSRLHECLLLSTCNRVEAYASVEDAAAGRIALNNANKFNFGTIVTL